VSELDAVRGQLLAFAKDIRDLYRQERQRAQDLQQALDEVSESYLSTMETLAFLIEAKDAGTRKHLDRTQSYALALARLIDPALADRPEIAHGFLLHDIGKVGVPERILAKQGPLTSAEWAEMRTHPLLGAQIVAPIRMLGDAVDVIRFHHERFDGTGYPHGLKRQQIPLPARIFSVVDSFDAITSERPYRKARSPEDALDEIVRSSGTQFDPEIVEAFLILAEDGILPLTGADGSPFRPRRAASE
jgi:HD-GYP domain-containing protein (c-di-GMP phosphodiesterase class II)